MLNSYALFVLGITISLLWSSNCCYGNVLASSKCLGLPVGQAQRERSSVLVVGVAGVLGSNLARYFYQCEIFKHVIGLDSYNSFSSPTMKRKRSDALLANTGIIMKEGSACNSGAVISGILEAHKISHIFYFSMSGDMDSDLECLSAFIGPFKALDEKPLIYYALPYQILPTSRVDQTYRLTGFSFIGMLLPILYGPWDKPDGLVSSLFGKMLTMQEIAVEAWKYGTYGKDVSHDGGRKMRETIYSIAYIDDITFKLAAFITNTSGIAWGNRNSTGSPMSERSPVCDFRTGFPQLSKVTLLRMLEKVIGVKALIREIEPLRTANYPTSNQEVFDQHVHNNIRRLEVSAGSDFSNQADEFERGVRGSPASRGKHKKRSRSVSAAKLKGTHGADYPDSSHSSKTKTVPQVAIEAVDLDPSLVTNVTWPGVSVDGVSMQRMGLVGGSGLSISMTPIEQGLNAFVSWYWSFQRSWLPCASECLPPAVSPRAPIPPAPVPTPAPPGAYAPVSALGSMCFASAWDAAAEVSKELTQDCDAVYYTVATGAEVDALHHIGVYQSQSPLTPGSTSPSTTSTSATDGTKMHPKQRTCNIAFVSRRSRIVRYSNGHKPADNATAHLLFGNWHLVLLEEFAAPYSESRKPSRVPKITPRAFFAPSVRYAVYMDSKLKLNCDPSKYVAKVSAEAEASVLAASTMAGGQGTDAGACHSLGSINSSGSVSAGIRCSISGRISGSSSSGGSSRNMDAAIITADNGGHSGSIHTIKLLQQPSSVPAVGQQPLSLPRCVVLLAVRVPVHSDVFADIDFVLHKNKHVRPGMTHFPELLQQQRRAYKSHAMQHKLKMVNMLDGGFLVHDLRSTAASTFRCRWFEQYQHWSDRDQISAAYALSVLEREAGVMNSRRKEHILMGYDSCVLSPSADSTAPTNQFVASNRCCGAYVQLMDSKVHWKNSNTIATLSHFGWNG